MESPFRPTVPARPELTTPQPGPLPPGLQLIETFARRGGTFVRLDRHLARLERTAHTLAFPYDPARIAAALAPLTENAPDPARIRLTLARDGTAAVTAAPLGPSPEIWRLALHPDRLDPADPWLRLKTTARARYDRARAALPEGIDEWLFLNTRGELCEGTITNLFLRREGTLLTPPLTSGLLPGVLRETLLEEGAREAVLRVEDLREGGVFVGNSLRGLMRGRVVG